MEMLKLQLVPLLYTHLVKSSTSPQLSCSPSFTVWTSVVFQLGDETRAWKWRETAAASGVSMKAAHLLTPCCVNSTPAWVCMFSHWPTELFHFMPSEDLWCGQIHSREWTHDATQLSHDTKTSSRSFFVINAKHLHVVLGTCVVLL